MKFGLHKMYVYKESALIDLKTKEKIINES